MQFTSKLSLLLCALMVATSIASAPSSTNNDITHIDRRSEDGGSRYGIGKGGYDDGKGHGQRYGKGDGGWKGEEGYGQHRKGGFDWKGENGEVGYGHGYRKGYDKNDKRGWKGENEYGRGDDCGDRGKEGYGEGYGQRYGKGDYDDWKEESGEKGYGYGHKGDDGKEHGPVRKARAAGTEWTSTAPSRFVSRVLLC
ncbi:hypothetical protein CF319_g7900 [Tilletia indica]|nr:hypothetical protein CF319_g7900 [Tilletia indica]